MLEDILAILNVEKAMDVEVIDLPPTLDYAHKAVLVTALSNRHVTALADKIADMLKSKNHAAKGIHLEGLESKNWVLLDAGSVIVHIFMAEERARYNLSSLYSSIKKGQDVGNDNVQQ